MERDCFRIDVVMTVVMFCSSSSHVLELTEVVFKVHSDEIVLLSQYTDDVFSESLSMCALMCLLQEKCCVASFSDETSICRLDKSENCCAVNTVALGSRALKRNNYVPPECTECVRFGMSLYKIIEVTATWSEAMNNCTCFGGYLAEIETEAESGFITNELFTRNTGAFGYWLGGYNFNNDSDLEWISKPNERMPYYNFAFNEPNQPASERCLLAYTNFNFEWVDVNCHMIAAYVCHGYWLGGLNFNNDSDLEWISKPNERMPYTYWAPNEPSQPSIENYLMAFKHRNFKWDECKCQGGKLIEIETKKENDFILTALKTRNTGALGYWLGGYNFNNDFDLEWMSYPGQDMPFDGTGVGEPNNPFTELCLAAWEDIGFNWADISCGATYPYICEFSAD
ncbi:MRC [Mytilus coruscus]|uniref:MRC n=1 Tax=Mytilus coruscus TaxID=42192 RepID=A0A6J8CPS3_MYTCO|nr:MRC [Mytilus coruscus]